MVSLKPLTREHCLALDEVDPLASLRDQFQLPEGKIYLDGNSLGVLPRSTPKRLQQVATQEWGQDLIQSWNSADWIHLPQNLGNKVARIIGAAPGECIVTDTLSINLFKVLSVAIELAREKSVDRTVVLSDNANFPSDLYIAQSIVSSEGFTLQLIDPETITEYLKQHEDVAVLLFTPVDYRTGRLLDMKAITAAAHAAGALVIWDLAHSSGAHCVDLHGCDADFAVGCGYKFLNGGPGAPAFVWVHPRYVNSKTQPLQGWLGHATPFSFTNDYVPAEGIQRYICSTPSILAMAALECGIDTLLAAEPLGGMNALREKSISLTQLFIECIDMMQLDNISVVSPRDPALRGSQVSLRHPTQGYAMVQALISRGIVGDFRAPDILRFGFTPLYTRYIDVWNAAIALSEVIASKEYLDEKFQTRNKVT